MRRAGRIRGPTVETKLLTDKNAKLKKRLAEEILDNAMLKDPKQKMVTPAGKRQAG